MEVDHTTTAFRVSGEWIGGKGEGLGIKEMVPIRIDDEQSTAERGVHYIHAPDEEEQYDNIGKFTFTDARKMYREVEIKPENITEEVVIVYKIERGFYAPANLLLRHKVILRPLETEEVR